MASTRHPGGHIKHGVARQALRMLELAVWFNLCCFVIHTTQLFCSPLYFMRRKWFYYYIRYTKEQFGILMTSITQWFTPTLVRVSGDESVRGQMEQTKDGRLVTHFPDRIILIANHQIYTEWLYLWWIAYTSKMHGAIYILLKESLKYIPMLGPAMMFYGFVFMSRNWAKDQSRMAHRMHLLSERYPQSQRLDPMWLLIFPEGTNLSANTRRKSKAWADKSGSKDFEHLVIPRSTGMLYCIQQLRGTVDWIYDCTIAYEGIQRDQYAQDFFTIRSTFLQGRPPKSVNMYWRRFKVADIPTESPKAFKAWIMGQWEQKEELIEYFYRTGRFPADKAEARTMDSGENSARSDMGKGYIETAVKLGSVWDISQIFLFLLSIGVMSFFLAKVYYLIAYGSLHGGRTEIG